MGTICNNLLCFIIFIILIYIYLLLLLLFSSYVDDLKKLLFYFPKEREEISKKYASRTPEPLNQQFSERLSKEEAIKAYNTKKGNEENSIISTWLVNSFINPFISTIQI